MLLQFNRFAIMTGIASLGIVAVYPFMKRITWWPQIVLGLAFSWGALMGWAVALGRLDLTALLLYAGSIAWVIGYDTIYAHQDSEDDALIGVKSTARLFGARTQRALAVFYSLAVVLIGVALVLARRALAGMDRAGRVRRASRLADPATRHRRSRAVPADVQIQPRCGAVAVRGIAGRCGDALICRVGKGASAPCPPSSIPLVRVRTLQLWPTSAIGGIADMAGLAAGSTRS